MLYFPQSVVAHTRVIVAQEEWDPVQQMCPEPGQPHLTDVPVSKQMMYLLCYGQRNEKFSRLFRRISRDRLRKMSLTVTDPGFPEVGVPTLQGSPTKFSPELHKNRGECTSLAPP